jgi:hypothetical protein
MALKLLQPGYLPLGQFDVDEADTIRGGYHVVAEALDLTDGYAADLKSTSTSRCQFSVGAKADDSLGGLADDGSTAAASAGYGTLFGTAIGGVSGQGTGLGTLTTRGATVIGPATTFASGKVTVWTQQGLYGVSSDSLTTTGLGTVNADVSASSLGVLQNSSNGVLVGVSLGLTTDTSLVSTSNAAAGSTASQTEYYAIYLFGPSAG